MGIRLDNDGGYEDFKEHIDHKIVVVGYGSTLEPPANIAIKCEKCKCVLIDFNKPEKPPTRCEIKAKKSGFDISHIVC